MNTIPYVATAAKLPDAHPLQPLLAKLRTSVASGNTALSNADWQLLADNAKDVPANVTKQITAAFAARVPSSNVKLMTQLVTAFPLPALESLTDMPMPAQKALTKLSGVLDTVKTAVRNGSVNLSYFSEYDDAFVDLLLQSILSTSKQTNSRLVANLIQAGEFKQALDRGTLSPTNAVTLLRANNLTAMHFADLVSVVNTVVAAQPAESRQAVSNSILKTMADYNSGIAAQLRDLIVIQADDAKKPEVAEVASAPDALAKQVYGDKSIKQLISTAVKVAKDAAAQAGEEPPELFTLGACDLVEQYKLRLLPDVLTKVAQMAELDVVKNGEQDKKVTGKLPTCTYFDLSFSDDVGLAVWLSDAANNFFYLSGAGSLAKGHAPARENIKVQENLRTVFEVFALAAKECHGDQSAFNEAVVSSLAASLGLNEVSAPKVPTAPPTVADLAPGAEPKSSVVETPVSAPDWKVAFKSPAMGLWVEADNALLDVPQNIGTVFAVLVPEPIAEQMFTDVTGAGLQNFVRVLGLRDKPVDNLLLAVKYTAMRLKPGSKVQNVYAVGFMRPDTQSAAFKPLLSSAATNLVSLSGVPRGWQQIFANLLDAGAVAVPADRLPQAAPDFLSIGLAAPVEPASVPDAVEPAAGVPDAALTNKYPKLAQYLADQEVSPSVIATTLQKVLDVEPTLLDEHATAFRQFRSAITSLRNRLGDEVYLALDEVICDPEANMPAIEDWAEWAAPKLEGNKTFALEAIDESMRVVEAQIDEIANVIPADELDDAQLARAIAMLGADLPWIAYSEEASSIVDATAMQTPSTAQVATPESKSDAGTESVDVENADDLAAALRLEMDKPGLPAYLYARYEGTEVTLFNHSLETLQMEGDDIYVLEDAVDYLREHGYTVAQEAVSELLGKSSGEDNVNVITDRGDFFEYSEGEQREQLDTAITEATGLSTAQADNLIQLLLDAIETHGKLNVDDPVIFTEADYENIVAGFSQLGFDVTVPYADVAPGTGEDTGVVDIEGIGYDGGTAAANELLNITGYTPVSTVSSTIIQDILNEDIQSLFDALMLVGGYEEDADGVWDAPPDVSASVRRIGRKILEFWQNGSHYFDGNEAQLSYIEELSDAEVKTFATDIVAGLVDRLAQAAKEPQPLAAVPDGGSPEQEPAGNKEYEPVSDITPEDFSPKVKPFVEKLFSGIGFPVAGLTGPVGEIPASLLEAMTKGGGVTASAAPQTEKPTWVGLLYALVSPESASITDTYEQMQAGASLKGFELSSRIAGDKLLVSAQLSFSNGLSVLLSGSYESDDDNAVFANCLLLGSVLTHATDEVSKDLLANMAADQEANNTVPAGFLFGGENGEKTTDKLSPDEVMPQVVGAIAEMAADADSYPNTTFLVDIAAAVVPNDQAAVEGAVAQVLTEDFDAIASLVELDHDDLLAYALEQQPGWMTLDLNRALVNIALDAPTASRVLTDKTAGDEAPEVTYMEPVGLRYDDLKLGVSSDTFVDAFLEDSKSVTSEVVAELDAEQLVALGAFLHEYTSVEQVLALRWRVTAPPGQTQYLGYEDGAVVDIMMELGVPGIVTVFGAAGLEEPDWFENLVAGDIATDSRFLSAIAILTSAYDKAFPKEPEQPVAQPAITPATATKAAQQIVFNASTALRKIAAGAGKRAKLINFLAGLEAKGFAEEDSGVYGVHPEAVGSVIKFMEDDISSIGTDGISLTDLMAIQKMSEDDLTAAYVAKSGAKPLILNTSHPDSAVPFARRNPPRAAEPVAEPVPAPTNAVPPAAFVADGVPEHQSMFDDDDEVPAAPPTPVGEVEVTSASVKQAAPHLDIPEDLSDTVTSVFGELTQDMNPDDTWLDVAKNVASDPNVQAGTADMTEVDRTRLILDAIGVGPDDYDSTIG